MPKARNSVKDIKKLGPADIKQLKARPQIRQRTPDFVSIYSNTMNVETNFLDVRLFFGEISEASEEKVVMAERIAIILAPEQALSVFRALAESLQGYETRFGAIRKPPE